MPFAKNLNFVLFVSRPNNLCWRSFNLVSINSCKFSFSVNAIFHKKGIETAAEMKAADLSKGFMELCIIKPNGATTHKV